MVEYKKETQILMHVFKSWTGKLVRYELVEDQISYEEIDPYSYFEVNSKKYDIWH